MSSPERCRSLWDICDDTLQRGVPGCFVECGVWKGGASAIMGLTLRHTGQIRNLHLFDSFEGLPEPGAEDGTAAAHYSGGRASGALASIHQCEAGLADVKDLLLQRLQLSKNQVHFHVGWFQNTVPKDADKLGPIAVLRLDGDWYESTRVCLEHLYPLLSPGGTLILDDYFCWEGCRKAVDEYRTKHGIDSRIVQVDVDCGYWQKAE